MDHGTADVAVWDLPSNHERLIAAVDVGGRRVVDVGCGAGALVRFLRSAGADAVGVECGEVMLADARAADPDHPGDYIEGVGQDLPLDDASADVVVFSYSLHHVPADSMGAAVEEAARVLRPGGQLVVLEPIADGPGYETHRLIDDEAEVRALAQAALDGAPAALVESAPTTYVTSYSYADFDELERQVVAIDPDRQAAFAEVGDEVRERFDALGVVADGRTWFTQPVILRSFTRT